jgi:hypothetical protein
MNDSVALFRGYSLGLTGFTKKFIALGLSNRMRDRSFYQVCRFRFMRYFRRLKVFRVCIDRKPTTGGSPIGSTYEAEDQSISDLGHAGRGKAPWLYQAMTRLCHARVDIHPSFPCGRCLHLLSIRASVNDLVAGFEAINVLQCGMNLNFVSRHPRHFHQGQCRGNRQYVGRVGVKL